VHSLPTGGRGVLICIRPPRKCYVLEAYMVFLEIKRAMYQIIISILNFILEVLLDNN